jgi:translocation and assembly module TamA
MSCLLSGWRRRGVQPFLLLPLLWLWLGASASAQELPVANRFAVQVEAPAEAKTLLESQLRILGFRQQPDLDEDELQRLMVLAEDDAAQLLGTQGWFSPTVQLRLEPSAEFALGVVHMQVDTGQPSRIVSVDLYFQGALATQDASLQESLRSDWSLPQGERFTQADWDRAKNHVLRQLTSRRYPAARLVNSLADVDAPTQSVRLSVELDSGPAVTVGEVLVEGLERYAAVDVVNLVRLSGARSGNDYQLEHLQEAQRRLLDTGLYESVFVSIEPSDSGAESAIKVQVREARLQKLLLGVGGSSDNGPRLTLEHKHTRLPGVGGELLSKGRLEKTDREWSEQWRSRPDAQGWRWVGEWEWWRLDIPELQVQAQTWRLGQSQDLGTLNRSFFAQVDRDRSVESGVRRSDSAISASYAWSRRRFDQEPFPRSGHGLGAELGAGTTLGNQRHPFLKLRGRWLGYWSWGQQGRWALRADGGAVWAAPSADVPVSQRFLLGGDTSVRGYAPRSIGVKGADGWVNPGRYQVAASAEWQRPLSWGNGAQWEQAVFVDMGMVADKPGDLRPQWGVGTGLRFNSPVGPLQADLAYGVTPKRWRLHLRVGFVF